MARPAKPFIYGIGEVINTKYGKFQIEKQMRIKRKNSDICDKKYVCRCLECGEIQEILEGTLERGIGSCRACGDTKSYPAKFFYWFLKQTGINFQTEYSPKWLGRYRFDYFFIVNGKEYIVEIDGAQHYTHGHKRLTVEEVKALDRLKDSMAIEHDIEVIRIDCRESKGKVIEEAIKNSKLIDIFDLSDIDWKICSYKSISNKYRTFCDLWNSGKNTTQIEQVTGSNANYISKCLQECAFYGLCEYDPKKESYRGSLQSTNGKKLRCLETGEIFDSAQECSRVSVERFGTFLKGSGITRVCRRERPKYKGYSFEYV